MMSEKLASDVRPAGRFPDPTVLEEPIEASVTIGMQHAGKVGKCLRGCSLLRSGVLETAERQQKLAEAAIGKPNEQVQGLEAVVRDQIRRAVVEEMKSVQAETQKAVEALQRVKRAANARVTLWTIGLTVISAGIALFVVWWVLPTRAEIAALRTERAHEQRCSPQSARCAADLRRCGTGRLCIRVDRSVLPYGDQRDYFVIRGY